MSSGLRIKQINYLDTESGKDLAVTSFKNCNINLVFNSNNDQIRDQIIQEFHSLTTNIPPNRAAKPQGTIIVPLHNTKIDQALNAIKVQQQGDSPQPIGTKPMQGSSSGQFFYKGANLSNGGQQVVSSSASLQISNWLLDLSGKKLIACLHF